MNLYDSKLSDIIHEGNWSPKGAISGAHGEKLCLFNHLITTLDATYRELWAVEEAIRTLFPERYSPRIRQPAYHTIAHFNDHDETTLEDIRRVCKVAGV
jgi:hypothetical protein